MFSVTNIRVKRRVHFLVHPVYRTDSKKTVNTVIVTNAQTLQADEILLLKFSCYACSCSSHIFHLFLVLVTNKGQISVL